MGGLEFIGAALIYFIEKYNGDKNIAEQTRRDAREAITKAYHATCGYYAKRDQGAPTDVGLEHDIAALWDVAATRVQPIDEMLANRLGLKSRYWREGAAWSDEQIADAKIQLDKINWDARIATGPKSQ